MATAVFSRCILHKELHSSASVQRNIQVANRVSRAFVKKQKMHGVKI